MRPAGRGWAKDSGLFDEEELLQIESGLGNVGKTYTNTDEEIAKFRQRADPLGADITSVTRVGKRAPDTILIKGVLPPDPPPALTQQELAGFEKPEAPPVAGIPSQLGLDETEIFNAMQSDRNRRLFDKLTNAGAMALAGLTNQQYRPIVAEGTYNDADKVRQRQQAGKEFDLRTAGAEAKAKHWEELAGNRDAQLVLAKERLNQAASLAGQAEAGKTNRSNAEIDARLRALGLKLDSVSAENEKKRKADAELAKLKASLKKGKGGGATAGSTPNALFGYDENFDVEMQPGYPKLDTTTSRMIGKKITYNRNVKESLQRIKELTRRSMEHPIESVADGTNAQLKSLVEFSIPTLATAQEQGVVNAGDAPRARATMAQYEGLSAQGVFDRLNALTSKDKEQLYAFEKGIDETIAAFQRGVDSEFTTKRLRLVPRKGAAASSADAVSPQKQVSKSDPAKEGRNARIEELKKNQEERNAKIQELKKKVGGK